jgi:hypothetical protein
VEKMYKTLTITGLTATTAIIFRTRPMIPKKHSITYAKQLITEYACRAPIFLNAG